MQSTQQFQALHGCSVYRKEVEQLIDMAKEENNTDVVYRLSRVLNSRPKDNYFTFEIVQYPNAGLTGKQHTGDLKEALDDCGRLRKGYKFVAGKVVKVEPKKLVAKFRKAGAKAGAKTSRAKSKTTVTDQESPAVNKKATVVRNGKKMHPEKITIIWAEGNQKSYDKFPKDYKTFAEAHKAVLPIYYDNIKHGGGGYNKVKFTITFPDGEIYEGRLDVSEKEDNPTKTKNVIGVHVYEFLKYSVEHGTAKEIQEIEDYLAKYSFEDSITIKPVKAAKKNAPEKEVKVIAMKPNQGVSETKKYDFIYEVSSNGGYVIKSFLELPISQSVKNKKLSDTIPGLYNYNATAKGLAELKKAFPNNIYGDKYNVSSKFLNKPLSLFGAKKKASSKKPGLKSPVIDQPAKTFSNNSRVKKIGERSATQSEFYTVNGEVGKFLQRVEKKPFESVVITIDGEQGAGKTTLLYQFMDAFASAGNRSLFISGEEHPESELAIQKTEDYISSKAKHNLDVIGKVTDTDELYSLIADYDIIFIDSWQKLQRMIGAIRLDEDLRQKFNGKVFVIIFQQTTTGRTKGGAEVVFDGDIIIKMDKSKETFTENYAWFDKNRYTLVPIETIRYNIAKGQTYNPNKTEAPTTEAKNIDFSFNIK